MHKTYGALSRKSVAWLMGKSVSELYNTYIFTVKITIWPFTVVNTSEYLTPALHCVLCAVEQITLCAK